MPLSEEEMRLLEQMERALSEEDPKFANALRGTPIARATKGRLVISAVAFLAGVTLLMTGAVMQFTWLGIIGFVVMLASATIGFTAWRARHAPTEESEQAPGWVPDHPSGFSVIQGGKKGRSGPSRSAKSPKPARSGGFMQRMEERWQRRRDQRDGGF